MQNKTPFLSKKLLVYILPAFLLYGCGVWENFTTYFNLYYNAKDQFEQAEADINQKKTDLFSTDKLLLPQSASSSLTKVVEKCSQILQFHAESSYIDDALFLLGKAFFYQANYQKALRKFNELIATQPKSDLILQTRLWIGKTQMQLKDYDKALATLEAVRTDAAKQEEDDVVSASYIEEIKYKISQQDQSGAIDLLNKFLEVSSNGEVNAEAVLELGHLYDETGDVRNAIKSYQKVDDYSPTYDIKYRTQVELGIAYREAGDFQKSYDLFEDMRSEDKYSDSFSEIDLQKGLTLIKLDRLNEAVGLLKTVDTTYSRTPSSGIAEFTLGGIYMNTLKNYDSAEVYYSKSVSSAAPIDTINQARDKVDLLRKYGKVFGELHFNMKQLQYSVDPEAFIKDSVAFYSDTANVIDKTPEVKVKTPTQVISESGRNTQNFSNQQTQQTSAPRPVFVRKTETKQPPRRPDISADSIKYLIQKNKFEMGNLFFTEFNILDSAYVYYKDILTNYPDSPFKARTLYALGAYYLTENDSVKADSLFNIVYTEYKDENIVNAAADKLNKPFIDLHFDPAKALYIKAEKEMFAQKYDSSLTGFYNIYKNNSSSPFAPKALYAYGWILENELNLNDSAAVIYDSLASQFPSTEYAQNVAPKINYYHAEKKKIAKEIADSLYLLSHPGADSLASDSLKVLAAKGKTELKDEAAKVENEKQALAKEESNRQDHNVQSKVEGNRVRQLTGAAKKERLLRNQPANPDTLIRSNHRGPRKSGN